MGLSHTFSVDGVSEFLKSLFMLNSETSIVLEEYYRVCTNKINNLI